MRGCEILDYLGAAIYPVFLVAFLYNLRDKIAKILEASDT